MITVEHLRIYHRYNKDIDSFARSGSNHKNQTMTDDIWFLIENFESDIEVIKKGLASKEYETRIMRKLEEMTDIESRKLLLEDKAPESSSWISKLLIKFKFKKSDF